MIHIDHEKCSFCGRCAEVCGPRAIVKNASEMELKYPATCIDCYHCVAMCPEGAITCDEFPIDAFEEIKDRNPVAPEALTEHLLQRRSVREFKKKEVPQPILEQLVQFASQSPTCHNDQGVELTVISSEKVIDKVDARIFSAFESIAKIANKPLAQGLIKTFAGDDSAEEITETIKGLTRFRDEQGNRQHLVTRGAPVLIVAHAGRSNTSAKDDCIIALDQVMMVATAHGLGSTWIGMITGAAKLDPGLKKIVGVPLKNIIHGAIILGWPKYQYKRKVPRATVPVKWIL